MINPFELSSLARLEQLFRMEDYAEAANCAIRLMESRSAPAVHLVYSLAGVCFRRGDLDLAARLCESLLNAFPHHNPTSELLQKVTFQDKIYRTPENPVVPMVQIGAYQRFTPLVAGKKVVEVGCGLGVGSQIMAEAGAVIVATDIEFSALQYARQHHPAALGYVQCSATALPFAQMSFEFATCVDVIEHIPDYASALIEMKRVTKTGVLVSTPNRLPENTNPDGSPRNYWHQFEWTEEEILAAFAPHFPRMDLDYLCGSWDNPYLSHTHPADKVQALVAIAWNTHQENRSSNSSPYRSVSQRPAVHFVYAGNPLNDESLRAPETIANHLYRYLEKNFPAVTYRDWASVDPLDLHTDDILLGHPNYDEHTALQRAFREADSRAKFLIFPFHHGFPEINLPFDPLVRKADRVFSITGEYWYRTIDQSPFAHWKEKMVRVDMAVDASRFPLLKNRFNPPGQRVLFYLGHDTPEKGVAQLARLVRQTGMGLVYAGMVGNSRPLFDGLDVLFLGPIQLDPDRQRWIAESCDFFVNTSVSDANPTTILEMAAIGLPVVCTPQSGYTRPDLVYSLDLNDPDRNLAVLNALQNTSETGLLERTSSARTVIERDYTWEKFCRTVFEGMENYL